MNTSMCTVPASESDVTSEDTVPRELEKSLS